MPSTEVPYAADAEQSLSFDELEVNHIFTLLQTCLYLMAWFGWKVLRIQYEKELEAGHVTVQTRFNYAWGLVKSPKREDQVQGVKVLQGMWFTTPIDLTNIKTCFSLLLVRAIPARTFTPERVLVLPRTRTL